MWPLTECRSCGPLSKSWWKVTKQRWEGMKGIEKRLNSKNFQFKGEEVIKFLIFSKSLHYLLILNKSLTLVLPFCKGSHDSSFLAFYIVPHVPKASGICLWYAKQRAQSHDYSCCKSLENCALYLEIFAKQMKKNH